jgi:plastocyanin
MTGCPFVPAPVPQRARPAGPRRARPVACARPVVRAAALAGVAAALVAVRVPPLAAQSVLDRPPNLGGTWVGPAGTLHFNFLHRFVVGDAPARRVSNAPTFLMAAGLPARVLAGARYASNSEVVPGLPNEWEFFARWQALSQAAGAPVDAALHGGWNQAAASLDGELALARRFGRLRVLGAARGFTNAFDAGDARAAVGAGAVLRLTGAVGLAGDWAVLLGRREAEDAVWAVGLQLAIPYTPHSLSLHVTNANTTTLHGGSAGTPTTRWGFEFTVPFTPSRYFGRRPAAAREADDRAPVAAGAGDTVRVVMQALRFDAEQLVIGRGATVVWVNADPVEHSVVADGGAWDSGGIPPGGSWSRRFDGPGRWEYHCGPHPFMRAVLVVR